MPQIIEIWHIEQNKNNLINGMQKQKSRKFLVKTYNGSGGLSVNKYKNIKAVKL